MMSSFSDKVTNQWIAFSPGTFFIVVVGGFAVWFAAGMTHFLRGDVL